MAAGPAIGERIGDYRVLSKLGEGGMGVVYLAEDVRLGRKVALKALARDYADDPGRRTRFLNEARAAAALSHPGVAAVYELEERGDDVFIIFEYVEGRTLRALLESGSVALSELLEIGLQTAQALEAAHAKGIVHRDLKPENVMVRRGAGDAVEVKILDFGLARFDSGVFGGATTQSFGLTQAGTVMGTVGYMSPEQLGGKPADFRTDIFSFGVLLYELASGTHPFAGETPASTIANVMMQEPPPLTAANALHPPELERIVRKCLRKARDDRYQSTRELVVDLKNLKHDSGERPTATMAAVVAPAPTPWSPPTAPAVPTLGRTLLRTRTVVGLVMAPANIAFAWVMKDWMGQQPFGTGLFFVVVICMAVAIGLRSLLLSFMFWRPEELQQAVAMSAPWAALANLATSTVLLMMVAQTYQRHLGFAAFVTFAAIGAVFVTLVVEPMMLRRAFPGVDPLSFTKPSDHPNFVEIQWIYTILLFSPVVDFAISGKPLGEFLIPFAAWPAAARLGVSSVALLATVGGAATFAWTIGAWEDRAAGARALRRFFPWFVVADSLAIAVWTLWLALVRTPPRPIFFLVLFLLYLPYQQLKLARAVPGSDATALPLAPPETPTAGERGKALTLAAMQAIFALAYALLGYALSRTFEDFPGLASAPPFARTTRDVTVALTAGGFFVCAASAVGFLRTPADTTRRFVRYFPAFAAVNLLAGTMVSIETIPLFKTFFLAIVAVVGTVFTTFYERRLARELAPPEPVTSRRDPRPLTLAALQAVFALCYAGMGVVVSQVFLDAVSGKLNMPHQREALAATTVLTMAGFFISAASAVGFVRQPREAARQFVRLFPMFAAANIFAGTSVGGFTVSLTNSFLLVFLLPIAAVSATFYQRRLARELAPPEPKAASRFNFRSPQTWWVMHQFANLLVLAPWVAYWGWLTRLYTPPLGKIVFLLLVLLLGAAWAIHFVLINVWAWNRPALPEQCKRLERPIRYVGLGIIATMLVQAGMAAAADDLGFGAAIGALAMGGLFSVLYIEPALVPPAE